VQYDRDFVRSFAGNSSALINGEALVKKGQFIQISQSVDGTLLFGQCQGSGKNPYHCSVDFFDPARPVARCSCPSRQFPCKHCVGLLLAALNSPVQIADIPEEILSKRQKIKARSEKKESSQSAQQSEPAGLTKAKATAIIKKAQVQLNGLDFADKLLSSLLQQGLQTLDANAIKAHQKQVMELGNYYLKGVQSDFIELFLTLQKSLVDQNYTSAIEQVNHLYGLIERGQKYLNDKINDYRDFESIKETSRKDRQQSPIEEALGTAWKLSELEEEGLYRKNEELLQLSFEVSRDEGGAQFVDEGIWLSLTQGDIVITRNYRPFKALKHVAAHDSTFKVEQIPELYLYPALINPRVRWERSVARHLQEADFEKIPAYAKGDYALLLREVKNILRQQLTTRQPVFLVRCHKLLQAGENLAIADTQDQIIPLKLTLFGADLLKLSQSQWEKGCLLLRFQNNLGEGTLWAEPLAFIDDRQVIRYLY